MKTFFIFWFSLKSVVLSYGYIFHKMNWIFTKREKDVMSSRGNDRNAPRRARGRPRDWNDKTEQNTIKSLDRAMAVLEFLSEAQGKALSTIAEEMGQSAATVYRVLVTLEGRGLVEFDRVEQVWHIGAQAFVIGSRYLRRTSLVERARPIMRLLMEETGETANLGVEKEGAVLFLSQVETHANIRAFFPPGTLSPMHASGIGKALLAHMEPARSDRILSSTNLSAFTDHTITDPAKLLENLGMVRERGYSVDNEEKNLGMRCIAAPVFDLNREVVAGISVSGPTSRVSESEIERLSRPVTEAAHQLTLAVGGVSISP